MNGFQMNGRVVDPQKQSVIVELLLMKKTQARLQQKVVSVINKSDLLVWVLKVLLNPIVIFVNRMESKECWKGQTK